MMKKKMLLTLGLLSTAALLLTACSSQKASDGEAGKKVVTVATDSDTAPFTYKDGDDFTGYDIDVLEAVFQDADDYELKFVTTAFDSILTGVDAGRYQIAANDFNYNEERSEKYLFSNPISKSNYAIASAAGTSYSSLDDLSGKATEVHSGSNYAQILEAWNKENADKDPIEINYVSTSTALTTRVSHIENGSIDFIIYDAISIGYIIEDQGFNLDVTKVANNIGGKNDGLEYFLFADSEEGKELQEFVNQRLKELKSDGSLAELSQKYFGGDFVSELD